MKQFWRDLLGSEEHQQAQLKGLPVPDDDIDDVVALMVDSRIDPQKFISNVRALLTWGMPSTVMFFTGKDEISCPTPSIGSFTSVIDRPPNAPAWVLAGFPDVLDWFNEQMMSRGPVVEEEDRESATAELFGIDASLPETELANSKGGLRARYYRNLIDNYKKGTGKALEAAVEEGSENDPYLGSDFLEALGEESNFTLIAAMTTKYYLELKRSYGSRFPNETSLIAMSGILDASAYIHGPEQLSPGEIVQLAKETQASQSHLLDFLIRFEALLLSFEAPQLSYDEVLETCQGEVDPIQKAIERTQRYYIGETGIRDAVHVAMESPQFSQIRKTAGICS